MRGESLRSPTVSSLMFRRQMRHDRTASAARATRIRLATGFALAVSATCQAHSPPSVTAQLAEETRGGIERPELGFLVSDRLTEYGVGEITDSPLHVGASAPRIRQEDYRGRTDLSSLSVMVWPSVKGFADLDNQLIP